MAGGLTMGLDWEALGADAAAACTGAHAVLVTGSDPIATAQAALGIGRSQSRGRRVAIGDLIGDVEPLHRLVGGDDPHGIVDSFLYGVSLNKIARQVDDSGMLFVMPSGTEPVVSAEIMKNERWRRLGAGFREVGALLLLVASSDAEGVNELALMMDGVIVVGDAASVLTVPRNSVLAQIDAPAVTPATPPSVASETAPSVPPPTPMDDVSLVPSATASPRPDALRDRAGSGAEQQSPLMLPAPEIIEKRILTPFPDRGIPQRVIISAAAVVIGAIALWLVFGRSNQSSSAKTPASEPTPATSAVTVQDSSAEPNAPGTSPTTAATDSLRGIRVVNPEDSLTTAAYGVVILATNDEAQALTRWTELGAKLPAGTVTMVRVRGERGRFFQMQAGAFLKARQADSLLAALRANGRMNAGAGSVVATPFALVLESKVSRRAAQNVADGYGQRKIAAYPLLQPDGSATIFVGAFETADQAVPLMNELKAKGVGSALYYRTGRSF